MSKLGLVKDLDRAILIQVGGPWIFANRRPTRRSAFSSAGGEITAVMNSSATALGWEEQALRLSGVLDSHQQS